MFEISVIETVIAQLVTNNFVSREILGGRTFGDDALGGKVEYGLA